MSPKTRIALTALVVGTLASGAAVWAQESPASPLTGTELVEFQSMDDSVGTVRPDDPSLYTMRLREDGSVSMKLNCNRATGTWTAEPGADGKSGRFELAHWRPAVLSARRPAWMRKSSRTPSTCAPTCCGVVGSISA